MPLQFRNKDLPERSIKSADIIAQRLREAIHAGNYAPGERLPAERELAEYFGASRGTVREALKRLEDEKLLVRKIGSGTFVNFQRDDG
ncbi:MAG: winged helix-turn-helix domain-containing protein, partial [Kiloniellales bacterium]|nr:winged helix-turn-helix domain-containing protein [Kiloniellales bacterium]